MKGEKRYIFFFEKSVKEEKKECQREEGGQRE